MKWKKFEKSQNFQSLTKFTKSFRCSQRWIIEIDQCKLTLLEKKDCYYNQNHLQTWIFYSCYLNASQHMIKIKINQIMKLIKRFSTLQKWMWSRTYCKKYCTLKFFAHQIQRNEMFFVFVAFMFDKFENEIWNDWFLKKSHSK